MEQLGGINYEYLKVFRLDFGTEARSKDYLQRARAAVLERKAELDFSKLLDAEMMEPAMAVR